MPDCSGQIVKDADITCSDHHHQLPHLSTIQVYVDYESLGATVKKGGNILLDDGIIKLEVVDPISRSYPGPDPMKPYTDTLCVVRNKNPVTLGARKGTNIPGAVLDLPPLTERDKRVSGFVGGYRVDRGGDD
jgi:pyruvate kinase